MPKIFSRNWNEKEGVCEKHYLPMIPCPQCLAEEDPDIQVSLDEMDSLFMEFENCTAKDLLPADDADWLVERIVT